MKLSALILLTFVILFAAARVYADPITSATCNLTGDQITGGYGSTGPFGAVTLTQDGSNVDFKVTLNDGSKFIISGAGSKNDFLFNSSLNSLTFDFGASPVLETSSTTSGSIGTGGAGDFNYGVDFIGQTNGGGQAIAGPLTFTVDNAFVSDFLVPNSDNNYFAVDLISGLNGKTGIVAGGATGHTTSVPEPAALLLVGVALIGFAGFCRKIRS